MNNETAFETICLILNKKPSEATWEDVVAHVIVLMEISSITTSFAVVHGLPKNLASALKASMIKTA